jgi:hypothetical protein
VDWLGLDVEIELVPAWSHCGQAKLVSARNRLGWIEGLGDTETRGWGWRTILDDPGWQGGLFPTVQLLAPGSILPA